MTGTGARAVRTLRAAALALAALALVCATASCSVIPTGVRAGAVEDEGRGNPLDPPYARSIAMPPNDEWDPEKIVRGFLAAMASTGDPGRTIARQYLTDGFAGRWKPSGEVTIYQQDGIEADRPVPDGTAEVRVTLKGTVTATIKEDGLYRPSDGDLREPFTLVRDARKRWRIDAGPEGLLLSKADADRAYREANLYFLDSKRKSLVIDQVRLPVNPASTLAKATVERLLEGASGSLEGAVQTAFAQGTQLIDVTTENDHVVVNLTRRASPDDIAAMSAQLSWTLSEIVSGSRFEVRVNGESYFPGSSLVIDAQKQLGFDPWMTPPDVRPLYLQDGTLRQLGKENVGEPVAGEAGAKKGSRIRPAVSGHALKQVAALSGDRKSISVVSLVQDGQWQEWATGNELVPPSWDRYHSLWTVTHPAPGTSVVLRHYYDEVKREVKQFRVSAHDLDEVEVTALKVARDGVHVAVAVRDARGDEEVRIGTVVGEGAGSRIDNLWPVDRVDDKQEIKDLAWKDGKTLYVLTGKSELLEASLTGESKPLGFYAHIESITALDRALLAGAVDDEGNRQILYWDSAKWQPLVKDENGTTGFTEDGPAHPAFPLG
ncbi:GerMN domain-containing protein [Planomonospora sp. ID67723]|uniref:LpqB family beta-propeller domain-containing protein n=1 Tax=Planomonospora sp. ID67723 TaxID=2738134 RepID=UPI0018C37081|nr:LpqB family beta-propeller domain-containing protein [Planomonospora sp. ID67723]MBG0828075.1 GerMN domain-containing protein [Planomonospora sp. ID67723]